MTFLHNWILFSSSLVKWRLWLRSDWIASKLILRWDVMREIRKNLLKGDVWSTDKIVFKYLRSVFFVFHISWHLTSRVKCDTTHVIFLLDRNTNKLFVSRIYICCIDWHETVVLFVAFLCNISKVFFAPLANLDWYIKTFIIVSLLPAVLSLFLSA